MSEIENTKKPVVEVEDWAIIPFDEAEDEARWTKLIEEMDDLEKKVLAHEAVFGKIRMDEGFSPPETNEKPPQADRADWLDEDPF